MPRCGSRSATGRHEAMIDSGTKIVRDQALTRYRLIGSQVGRSIISGGTAGHCS